MDTNEEMIEEINDIEEANNTNLDDTVVLEDISKIDSIEGVNNDTISENSNEVTDEAIEEYIKNDKKKKKIILITLLSILLVLDIIALVIYIIGVDKVIGFIK